MPTHIYTRLGDWDGVTRGNLRRRMQPCRCPPATRGEFVWDEFPHAIEYLVYAYLQQGKDDKRRGTTPAPPHDGTAGASFKTAFHLSSTQARFALERRDWQEAALIVPRQPPGLDWDRFAWPEAISQFAHGLGAAHLGKLNEARQAARVSRSSTAS
jgi:hypothetical protein